MPGRDRRNDARILFFAGAAFVIVLSLLFTLQALGRSWAEPVTIYAMALFAATLFGFSLVDIETHLYRVRFRREPFVPAANGEFTIQRIEYIVVPFILSVHVLAVLVAFTVRTPWGAFQAFPHGIETAADLATTMLAGASVLKVRRMVSHYEKLGLRQEELEARLKPYLPPNLRQNDVLRYLAYLSTAFFFVLFVRDGMGGPPVGWSILIYFDILFMYALHNRVLMRAFPSLKQRRRGELVALSVFLFSAAMLLAYGIGLMPHVPVLLALFCVGTEIIFVSSVIWAQLLADPIVRWLLGANNHRGASQGSPPTTDAEP